MGHSVCYGVHTGQVIWYDATSASSAHVLYGGNPTIYKARGPLGEASSVGEV